MKHLPDCSHTRGHVSDSAFHGHAYATLESRRIFCDECRLQRWLSVEAALALSQADVGMIPRVAADAIAAAARIERMDLEAIARETIRTRHSLMALIHGLERAAGEAAVYVHFGATTQDIQDTGQSLEIRDVLDALQRDLHELVAVLRPIASGHRDTLMVGRTHARAALPMTFGLKVASWLDELLRHLERIEEARPRLLVAQLGGGVGTMAAFAPFGPRLLERFASRLRLEVPRACWHSSRDRVAELGMIAAMVAATLARIADEIRVLGRPEIEELEESWSDGVIGSSTMPHKRNPEGCEQIVTLARLARAQVPLLLEAMVVEHERDGRALRLEWPALAEVSHSVLAALAMLLEVVRGLRVRADVMEKNVRVVAELLCTEPVLFALVPKLGKRQAYRKVYELSQRAQSNRVPLVDLLRRDEELRRAFTCDELALLLDPRRHLGAAGEVVDTMVAAAARGRKTT
jgi:adenylosuccinate lyase